MKPYRFHRQADAEFAEAAQRYADISPELGQRFYHSIHDLIAEICAAPLQFRPFVPPARRHFRKPFPYAIVFVDRPDEVWIVAVMHFKRQPGSWRERLE